MGPGAYSAISTSGVNAVKSSSDKEKKDMQDLNERFASYIEKVRFLEAQNRRLSDELEKLKSKWGKETSQIKAMYQAELDEARRLLDEAVKEKARVEIRLASLEEQLEETNQKWVPQYSNIIFSLVIYVEFGMHKKLYAEQFLLAWTLFRILIYTVTWDIEVWQDQMGVMGSWNLEFNF